MLELLPHKLLLNVLLKLRLLLKLLRIKPRPMLRRNNKLRLLLQKLRLMLPPKHRPMPKQRRRQTLLQKRRLTHRRLQLKPKRMLKRRHRLMRQKRKLMHRPKLKQMQQPKRRQMQLKQLPLVLLLYQPPLKRIRKRKLIKHWLMRLKMIQMPVRLILRQQQREWELVPRKLMPPTAVYLRLSRKEIPPPLLRKPQALLHYQPQTLKLLRPPLRQWTKLPP